MKRPFHPFLFAAYFVIALLGLNITQVRPTAALRALGVVMVLTGLLWLCLKLLLHDWDKSAVLTSIYLLFFFTYGHIYHLLEPESILGIQLGRHRLLIPLSIVFLIIVTWLVVKKLKNPFPINGFLNILGIVALVFPMIQISSHLVRSSSSRQLTRQTTANSGELHVLPGEVYPDIYYIILDGYAREDFLADNLGFDNTEFLDELRGRGFYIADCSQSNYSQTSLSMASALNYNYLDRLSADFKSPNTNTAGLNQLIAHSAIRQQLGDLGYSFVAFETPYYWLRIPDADHYFAPSSSAIRRGEKLLPVNAFESMLLRESALVILTDSASLVSQVLKLDLDYPNKEHRELVLYALDKLEAIPLEIPSPKFVYAHILTPHFPIVFNQDGEYIQVPVDAPFDEFAPAHADQIRYVNQRMLSLVDEIVNTSATPPIIILQADHGNERAEPEERMAILNTYLLPGDGNQQLYSTITPVNTFRIILNKYFGGRLELLEDISYYSKYNQPYEYTEIPNKCASGDE